MRGKLIIIEGGEGAGKTSVVAALKRAYGDRKDVIFTREPGGTDIGAQIRGVLLDKKNTAMDAQTELLLFYADRAQHIAEVIDPALAAGVHVICDRADPSTVAYQIYRKQRKNLYVSLLALAARVWGVRVNELEAGAPIFDAVILLDVSPEVGVARCLKGRGVEGMNRIDAESQELHARVREGFHEMEKQNLFGPWHRVDAEQSAEKVTADVSAIVASLIGKP